MTSRVLISDVQRRRGTRKTILGPWQKTKSTIETIEPFGAVVHTYMHIWRIPHREQHDRRGTELLGGGASSGSNPVRGAAKTRLSEVR